MRDTVFEGELPVWETGIRLAFPGWVDQFPQWPVPVVRGVLGYALKARCEPERYAAIFKPGPLEPHRLMLVCAPGHGGASVFGLTLRLLGGPPEWLDECVAALADYGPRGLGPARIPYRLEADAPVEVPTPWAPGWRPAYGGGFRVRFVTPAQLTLTSHGIGPEVQNHMASAEGRRAFCHALAQSAARRLFAPPSQGRPRGLAVLPDQRGEPLSEVAERLNVLVDATAVTRTHLEWSEAYWGHRFIGGVTGWLDVEGPPELEQVFQAAALTGVGRAIIQGCGQVEVGPA